MVGINSTTNSRVIKGYMGILIRYIECILLTVILLCVIIIGVYTYNTLNRKIKILTAATVLDQRDIEELRRHIHE